MSFARTSVALILVVVMLTIAVGCQNPANGNATATTSAKSTSVTTDSTKGVPNVAKQYAAAPAMSIDTEKTYTAVMHTSLGDITFMLLPKEAPNTVNNFVFLARDGFYDNVPFHRIVKGFMVQSGDPTGTGRGGPGYRFNDEPVTRKYVRGTLAMANAGKNTNGSQFFIVHEEAGLPPNYTIFGYATSGLDVLDKIAVVPVTKNSESGENSKPTQDVRIIGIDITEN